MHRTVRILRTVLPLLFVGFIALIILSYTSKNGGDRPKPTSVISTIRTGDVPELEAHQFEDTQTIGGRTVSRIRARRTVGFKSGWYTLEDVKLTLFRKDGSAYDLSAPVAEFKLESKEAKISGGVRVTSTDGLDLSTEAIDFDGKRLLNEIPVTYKIDRWSGKAGGVDFSLDEERLRLFKHVEVTLAGATPGEPPMQLSSAEARFLRVTGEASFDQDVLVRRGNDRLRTESLKANFDQTRKTLVSFAGIGNVFVRMSSTATGGDASELGPGQKQITAERFYADIGPEGEIIAINALGESVPAHATFFGPPRREITAGRFRIGISGETVNEIRGDGKASVEEHSTPARVLRANTIIIFIDPKTREATSGALDGNVVYRDPRNEAFAERADYDIVGDRLIMTQRAAKLPRITADGNQIEASMIELAPKAGTLKATGRVVSRIQSKGKSTASNASAMFPEGNGMVFVNSNSLIIRRTSQLAIFTGNVRAWQGNNTIVAAELHLEGNGETLRAKGGVRSILYNARGSSRTKPVTAKSDQMVARKAERRVDLDGNVEIVDDTRRMTSAHAVLFFDQSQKIDRVEATGTVAVAERATGRTGSGDKVTYQLAQKTLLLEGAPAEISEPRGTIKGSKIIFDLVKNKVDVASGDRPTEATYNPDS